jgi:hypothetical protein
MVAFFPHQRASKSIIWDQGPYSEAKRPQTKESVPFAVYPVSALSGLRLIHPWQHHIPPCRFPVVGDRAALSVASNQ